MTKGNKSKGYLVWKNQLTGKRGKEKIDEEMEEFMSDEGINNKPFPDAIRILPCPYKFDKPEIAEKLTKPFKTAKFTCQVDVEVSIAVEPQVKNEDHIHKVIIDVDESKVPPEANLSEYEFDLASIFCGLYYSINPKVEVKLKNQEIIEDKDTLKLINKTAKDAVKDNKELAESGEKEANEQKLKNIENLFADFNGHFQEYLTEVIKTSVEKLEYEAYLLNERADKRESSIKIMLEEFEKELRKRLPTAKGRVPTKQRNDFNLLRSNFINECKKILAELESKKARLNKNQLAKKMFRGDNPLLLLNRKLKDFDLTFEEILQKYIEQKSS
jgi:hypothetical protein